MTTVFNVMAQQHRIRHSFEPMRPDEIGIRFSNRGEIDAFFHKVMKDPLNRKIIQQNARTMVPPSCSRSQKSRHSVKSQDPVERLITNVADGNAAVVIKIPALQKSREDSGRREEGKSVSSFLEKSDILKAVKKRVVDLRRIYSRIVNSDYYILDQVTNIPDDSIPGTELVSIDPMTVEEHTTGWRDWGDPFEVNLFGVLKTMVTFNVAKLMKLGDSAFLAAAAGYLNEDINCQYNIVGKSIITRSWYGSYCIRFNLKTWDYELAWVKYNGSGPEERVLVELTRTDRIVKQTNVLFTGSPILQTPTVPMDKFLADYRKGFPPPDHDILGPIRLNKGLFS